MRRSLLIAFITGIFAVAVPAALADNPNFHFANASVSSSTGALSVDFKLTGSEPPSPAPTSR